MVSKGIEGMMDYIFSIREKKITTEDLEAIIGELVNHFGEQDFGVAYRKVLNEREEARLDHIMGEGFESQKDYEESTN